MNAYVENWNANPNFPQQFDNNFGRVNFTPSADSNFFWQQQLQQPNAMDSRFLPQVQIGCPCVHPMQQPNMGPSFDQFQQWQFYQRQFYQPQYGQPLHFRYYQHFPEREQQGPQPYNHGQDQARNWDEYWRNYWSSYFRQLEQDPRYARRREPEPDREGPSRQRLPRNDQPAERPRNEPGERNNDQIGRIQDIVRHARESVGQALFRFIPGTPGNLGCAASVSAALNRAGFTYARHAGVGGLSQILQRNGWTRHEGLQNARPGDVVVIARRAGWENGGGGSHIGIVGENGKVYHNSSGRHQWIEDSLQRVFGGGMMRFVLRPPGSTA